ncbi:MAG TPA: hypothetical protein PL181_17260 [bacterium]|nr:hypothetical protein [bacterium]
MKLEEHECESLAASGQPWTEVHRWLDEFAGTPDLGMRHRRKRHHRQGIEEVRRRWGDAAAEAARQHIIADLKTEGWHETDHFPIDEADYVKMGLF